MAKKVDINGFWLIESNPITKEGVFPYSGAQIDFDGSLGLVADKVYNVYRPASELTKPETIASFDGDPLIDEHEMLGDGCTDYDSRPASGVMLNVRANDQKTGLISDLKIYSEDTKDKISGGKKELSLGYRCKYAQTTGVFDGTPYDFIQNNIHGNHLALVDKGRMGPDIRVFDSKAFVFDSIDEVNQIQIGADAMTDQEKAAEKMAKVKTALDGMVSDEEMTAVMDALEPKAEENPVKEDEDPEKKAEDEEKPEPKAEEKPVKEAEDEDPEKKAEDMSEKPEKDKEAAAMDAFPAFARLLAARDELVKRVEPLIGAFDSAVMTSAEVAVYACKKLGITCDSAEALPQLKGFLVGHKPDAQFTMDSAPVVGEDAALKNYLKGE